MLVLAYPIKTVVSGMYILFYSCGTWWGKQTNDLLALWLFISATKTPASVSVIKKISKCSINHFHLHFYRILKC